MITNTAMGMGKLTKVTMTWTNGYYDDEDDGGEKDHLDDNYYRRISRRRGENFEKNGHYRKGYDTHDHHKMKKVSIKIYKDFYDEDCDSDFDECNGGYHYDQERENGPYYNEDRYDYNGEKQDHGKRDHYEKGCHHRDRKGCSDDEDHEDYYYKDYHGEKDFRDYENK